MADNKALCLFGALLLMSAFYYGFEKPGPLRAFLEAAGQTDQGAEQGSAGGRTAVGEGRADDGPMDDVGTGSAPDWFAGLADQTKNEAQLDDETLAKARELQEQRLSADLSKNPRKLINATVTDARLPALALSGATVSGARFINCELPEFKAENVTFNHVKFHRVKIDKASLKNVTFNDCIFENSNIDNSQLENASFRRGEFRQVAAESVRDHLPAGIFNSSFARTSFDGVAFKDANIRQADGEISLLNLNLEKYPASSAELLSGAGLRLRVENCRFKNLQFGYLGDNSRLHALKSTFVNSGTRSGNGGSLYFENCRLEAEAALNSQSTVLMRDCRLNARIEAGKSSNWYFDDCAFEEDFKRGSLENSRTAISAEEGSGLYILGNGKPASLAISYRGILRIQGLKLEHPKLESRGWPVESTALDLRDVGILGGDLSNLRPLGGNWERVRLSGQIKTSERTGFEEVRGSELSLAEDLRWSGPAPALPAESAGAPWPGIELPDAAGLAVPLADH